MARTLNQHIADGYPGLDSLPDFLTKVYDLLVDLKARQAEDRTVLAELVEDHATFKTVVDELTAWAETLAAKMNSDAGINDTDYDATITADAPAALTASSPTAISAATPSDPDA